MPDVKELSAKVYLPLNKSFLYKTFPCTPARIFHALHSLLEAYPQGDGKAFVCDNHDRAVTCAFFRDLHLSLLCPGLLQIKISVQR